MTDLRVFTFSADWGLPTTGPFALKLLAWLRLAGVPYEQVFENDSRKGPLGKSPWIEHRGARIGDSDIIIRYVAEAYRRPIEPDLSRRERAIAEAVKAAFEERFHQVVEWELFVHPAGAAYVDRQIARLAPPVVGTFIARALKRHFARQLHARGIARHPPETIADIGRTSIDRLADLLDGRPYLTGDQPVLADLAVFGQVAPLVHWPMATPVALHAREVRPVVDWIGRVMVRCFGSDRAPVADQGRATRRLAMAG